MDILLHLFWSSHFIFKFGSDIYELISIVFAWFGNNFVPLLSVLVAALLLWVDRLHLHDLRKQYEEENKPNVIPHITRVFEGNARSALLCLSLTNYSKVVAERFHISINDEWLNLYKALPSEEKTQSLEKQITKYNVYLVPGDSLVFPLFLAPSKCYSKMKECPMQVTIEYYAPALGKKTQWRKTFFIDLDSISNQLTTPDSYVRIEQDKVTELKKIVEAISKLTVESDQDGL